ncbi:MAG: hypothetical protein O6952_06470 [Planctomycetota bacterium]|nr:hypothetical protein [Planctomycetota bacterium]
MASAPNGFSRRPSWCSDPGGMAFGSPGRVVRRTNRAIDLTIVRASGSSDHDFRSSGVRTGTKT